MARKSVLPTPTDEEIMGYNNVPVEVASRYVGHSTITLYKALQDGRTPFGWSVECKGGSWSYNISPGLLVKYKQGDLPMYNLHEMQDVIVDAASRVIDGKMAALKKVFEVVAV